MFLKYAVSASFFVAKPLMCYKIRKKCGIIGYDIAVVLRR